MRDTTAAYGPVTRGLHWLLTALIVGQFLWALGLVYLPEKSSIHGTAFTLHEGFGLMILVFGLLFIVWRRLNPKPSLADLPAWQRLLARLVHLVIYIAIVAQALIGIVLVMVHGYGVSFFGLFEIPQILVKSKSAGSLFGLLHFIVGVWVLLIALGLHIAGALYHQYFAGDRILARMWRGGN